MKRISLFLGSAALAGGCWAAEVPQSATELGCLNCHALDHKNVGPSWMDIAKRYRSRRNDPALLEQLVKNVSNGSQESWGNIPMVGNDPAGKKRARIVEVVKYILSVPDQAPETKRPPETKRKK